MAKTGVSIWERGDGRVGARFRYRAPDGTTKAATTTKPDRESAEEWAAQKERDYAEGVVSGPQTVEEFLREWLREWLREAVEPSVGRAAYLKREWAVRVHIAPALGGHDVKELEPRRVQALYASMAREGYSYATRREVHVTLKMALNQALRWRLTARDVMALVDAPRKLRREEEEEDEGEVKALWDEQARVLFRVESRWRNYYVVSVRTGLRPGERLRLRWGDLDLESDPGSLRVTRGLKTKGSRRTVALLWEAKEALLAQREMLRAEGLPTGRKDLSSPRRSAPP